MRMSEPEPIVTKTLDGRITEAKCSDCHEQLEMGNDVGSVAEQEEKMEDAFARHVQEKHSVAS